MPDRRQLPFLIKLLDDESPTVRESVLGGTETMDYGDPQNSNLVHVITRRAGLPISLACVYILVGQRMGLAIEGCNFPWSLNAVPTPSSPGP